MKSEEWAALKAQNHHQKEMRRWSGRPLTAADLKGRRQKEATWDRKMRRRAARRATKRSTTNNNQ
jgi:hypothetical protein